MTTEETSAFLLGVFFALILICLLLKMNKPYSLNSFLETHTQFCYEQEYKDYNSCKEFLITKALEKGK